MSGGPTLKFANGILNMSVGRTPETGIGLSDISTLRIALTNDTPDNTVETMADVTEVTGTSYDRVDPSADFASAAVAGAISNDGVIEWAEDTAGDWTTIRGWVLVVGATAGTTTDKVIGYNSVNAADTQAGDTVTIPVAQVSMTFV